MASSTAPNQRLTVELRPLTAFDTAVKIIFPVVDYWKRTGVDIDALVVPQQRQADRKYRAERPGFDLPQSSRNLTRHHSAEVALPENNYRGANRPSALHQRRVRCAHRPLSRHHSWKERMSVLRQIVHHMTDQITVMGLFYDISPVMVANRVLNVKASRGSSESGTPTNGTSVRERLKEGKNAIDPTLRHHV